MASHRAGRSNSKDGQNLTLGLDRCPSAPDDFVERISHNRAVPAKYLYESDEAWSLWSALCQDASSYSFFEATLQNIVADNNYLARHVAELVVNAMNAGDGLRVVSLGSGDGIKDVVLLQEIRHQRAGPLHYVPLDVNRLLLADAVWHARQIGLPVCAMVCDYLAPGQVPFLEHAGTAPTTLFLMLGNNVGHNDEAEALKLLDSGLRAGDLILFEVNSGETDALSLKKASRDPAYYLHDSLPLRHVGWHSGPYYPRYDVRETESIVPGTHTAVALADLENMEDVVKLCLIHHYRADAFAATITRRLDVDILTRVERNGILLLLCQRPR